MAINRLRSLTTGITGVYYVAAELSRRNYTALVTTRNTRASDILALNNETFHSIGIQVKTNSERVPHDHWLVNEKDYGLTLDKVKDIAWVFVNLNKNSSVDYFVVSGKEIAPKVERKK